MNATAAEASIGVPAETSGLNQQYAYDDWGNLTQMGGSSGFSQQSDNQNQVVGYRYDEEVDADRGQRRRTDAIGSSSRKEGAMHRSKAFRNGFEAVAFLACICTYGHGLSQDTSPPGPRVVSPTQPADVPLEVSEWDQQRGALIVEQPRLTKEGKGYRGVLWLDGLPLAVTPETRLLSAPPSTTFRFSLVRGWHVRPWYHDKGEVPFSEKLLAPNTWAIYHLRPTPDGRLAASQLRVWPNQSSVKRQGYLSRYSAQIQSPDYANHHPGTIRYAKGGPIAIVPNAVVQDWIAKVGSAVVPAYIAHMSDADATKIHFRFLVVDPFRSTSKNYLMDINGRSVGHGMVAFWDYLSPKKNSIVDDVLAMPDGTIIVPSTALSRMRTTSQVAALLSYAVSSVVQQQGYVTWSLVTRVIGHPFRPGNADPSTLIELKGWLEEQALRLGIRQMFLAGFDIRDAPYVWAIAEGKAIDSAGLDSLQGDKKAPWYATYAGNIVEEYYSDIDFSKLKRGEAEYQQVLTELRKADPEAFTEAVPQGKQ